MIRKAGELERTQSPNLKGGDGVVRIVNFINEAESGGGGRLFGVSIIPVGGSIGYHRHEGDFELYYILKGEAAVNDNGAEDTLHPGDVMLCRDGDSHGIRNSGDVELEYIALILYSKK